MKILQKLNITAKNIHLYETAFTHTSFANENHVESYERLEYLGDAVLELVMSDYLYNHTNYDEGKMTKLRAHYVCEEALYEYSLKLGLNEYLKLGHGEENNGGKYRKAIVADIYEALIGAIYLDQGFTKAREFINQTAIPFVKNNSLSFIKDYKSELQELVQTDQRTIEYLVVGETGPAHDKIFEVSVKIDGIIYGTGSAHSKKQAEQEAAKNALEKSVGKIRLH